MITPVRTAHPQIIMNGQDYYNALAPYFLNMEFTDSCDGHKADDFHLQLDDRDRKFINAWMPKKGAFVDVKIMAERWFSPNAAALVLDCGRFWIDSVEFELPQHTVTIKANSIPTNIRLKSSKETRGWEHGSLKEIASQICDENGMQLQYDSDINPTYSRVEQTEESGLQFLNKRAGDAKLAIKCKSGKLILFDESKYEAKPPSFTLVYGDLAASTAGATYRMSSGHFITKIVDTKKSARVSYIKTESGELTEEQFKASDSELPDQDEDKVNDNPDYGEDGSGGGSGDAPLDDSSLQGDWNTGGASAAGQLKAKSHVRKANKKKDTCHIELAIGNPLIAAGQTFTLQGVGQFDGKWFVETAKHKVGPMFTTELIIRRCLQGY